jgi:ABC-2 type transport system ATP-binding protein
MCDRVLVLEKGVLGYDGPTREGIRYLKYDNDPDDVSSENEDDFDEDADLGADI